MLRFASIPLLVAVFVAACGGGGPTFSDTVEVDPDAIGIIPINTELVLGDVFHWQELQAAALLVALPIALVFSLLLNRFVSGFTRGAVKG